LGWELYVSSDQACHVFEVIREVGKKYDLRLCGLHSLDSCRIEKAYRHFGHDITDEDHVLEAGLGFAVQTNKDDFIGKEAVIRKNNQGLEKYLYQFQLEDPELLLFHNEPIYRDGELVSYLTSGNYGHFLGSAIGMGYIPLKEETIKSVETSDFHIEIAGTMAKAKISSKPLYDPISEKIRM
jgi:4-methylaminobutanoate oxidase (formaldehyde-forming)